LKKPETGEIDLWGGLRKSPKNLLTIQQAGDILQNVDKSTFTIVLEI